MHPPCDIKCTQFTKNKSINKISHQKNKTLLNPIFPSSQYVQVPKVSGVTPRKEQSLLHFMHFLFFLALGSSWY